MSNAKTVVDILAFPITQEDRVLLRQACRSPVTANYDGDFFFLKKKKLPQLAKLSLKENRTSFGRVS